jgi:hypothetical protein
MGVSCGAWKRQAELALGTSTRVKTGILLRTGFKSRNSLAIEHIAKLIHNLDTVSGAAYRELSNRQILPKNG